METIDYLNIAVTVVFGIGTAINVVLDRRLSRRLAYIREQNANLMHEYAALGELLAGLERWDEEHLPICARCDAASLVEAAGLACVHVEPSAVEPSAGDQDEPTTPGQPPSDGTTRQACDWER